MSGDKVSISVDAFYASAGQDNSNSSVVADVVASLVSAFGGGSSTAMDPTGHYTIGDRNITSFNTTSYPDITSALKSDDPNTDNGKPKAYVNWILFDEQFNMVRSSSATRQVDMAADTRQQMAYTDIAMHSNGYLYVYLSNESPMNVFFDNFQVTHRHGPILEETHYYPFGLTMAGISSKALNNAPENKRKYNSIEFNEDLDLDVYDAYYRNLDPQTGRWWQIDPETDGYEDISPYASMYNNPIRISDPLGNEGDDCCSVLDELLDIVDKTLLTASGVVNGALNTVTGGLISTDPFGMRDNLSPEKQELYDHSVQVGQVGVLFAPGTKSPEITPALQPVNGPAIPLPVTISPVMGMPPMLNTNQTNQNNTKKTSNEKLIEEAKAQKAKEEAAKARQQNRQTATQRGNSRTGNSNQDRPGSHNSSKRNPNKHDKALKRWKTDTKHKPPPPPPAPPPQQN
jgi:RHS repeat-associated protein